MLAAQYACQDSDPIEPRSSCAALYRECFESERPDIARLYDSCDEDNACKPLNLDLYQSPVQPSVECLDPWHRTVPHAEDTTRRMQRWHELYVTTYWHVQAYVLLHSSTVNIAETRGFIAPIAREGERGEFS
nr:hypothetical protein CFP56_36165 [Quercus suber]